MAYFKITTAALNDDGARETVEFRCPDAGGYVYFSGGRNDGKQVCEGLYLQSVTLYASASTLGAVIRRELARRRRLVARLRAA
jgi:hypothetical protein